VSAVKVEVAAGGRPIISGHHRPPEHYLDGANEPYNRGRKARTGGLPSVFIDDPTRVAFEPLRPMAVMFWLNELRSNVGRCGLDGAEAGNGA